MTTAARRRLQLVEYGPTVDLAAQIARPARIERDKARRLIEAAGERAAKTLRFNSNPLQAEPNGFRAVDFAGMIRLGPSLELEVVPKFLGRDETRSTWREDFYFLANLSRHGRLLASERLRSSGNAPKDMASLVARAIGVMYWDNRRRPLRSYRRVAIDDVFIEGEVDPVDIRFPGPDGFRQDIVRYDRNNRFNAAVRAAATELLPEVGDSDAVNGLVRVIQDLPAQTFADRRRRRVPNRSRAWQPLVDLSHDVLDGFGISYKEGFASAPGYVLSTWQAWEDLLTIAVRLVYGPEVAAAQKPYLLGTRTCLPEGTVSNVRVYPDLIIAPAGDRPEFMLDAKYKTNARKGAVRIAESDTYEAMAHAKASSCEQIVLAYPASAGDASHPLGSAVLFERIKVGATIIYGVYVEVRGISKRGAVKEFGTRLRLDLEGILRAAY